MIGIFGRRIGRMIAVAMAIFMLSSMVVWAQDTTSISGTVSDPQGKVLGGATVTLTNTATQTKRETKTTDNGVYSFNQVAPGTYKVTVEVKGFKKVEVSTELVVRTPATV